MRGLPTLRPAGWRPRQQVRLPASLHDGRRPGLGLLLPLLALPQRAGVDGDLRAPGRARPGHDLPPGHRVSRVLLREEASSRHRHLSLRLRSRSIRDGSSDQLHCSDLRLENYKPRPGGNLSRLPSLRWTDETSRKLSDLAIPPIAISL